MRLPVSAVPLRRDVGLACGLAALSQIEVWRYGAGGGGVAGSLTLGAAGAVLAWRRQAPIITTCVVALALAACAQWGGQPFSATSVAAMTIGFFTIGGMPERRRSVVALAVAMVLSVPTVHPLTLNMYLAITFPSFLVPWLLGFLWSRRTGAAEAEAAQRAAAQAAVAEERLRLARELHDVVSHNVGMIAVQAGAADVLMDKNPQRSRESLRAIEGGARDTLLELRRLLGLLREDDPDPRALGPSLSQLSGFVTPAADAGVEVELRTDGDPVQLASAVEVTAYRIVQEALTNVVAHAGPCRVTVTLGYRPDALDVEVSDDGWAPGGTTRGSYGLVGLRERVTALGGSFEAGPGAGGGFRVHARLPSAA
jgi:signal transduction histidine kinase